MLAREAILETARRVYRTYGYTPIDTPALEYSEILLGKGGEETDKQMFRFADQGERDVAMRFDLTIPFARFAAQHLQEIGSPFRRYHMATVWRAEKPQKGRFREFMQCDFDTIGTDSNAADIETLLVINDLLEAIGFERFTIRINNRLLLSGLLDQFGLEDQATGLLRALDKLAKIGPEKVLAEMTERTTARPEQAERILALCRAQGTPEELLAEVEPQLTGSPRGEEGLARVRELFAVVQSAGLPAGRVTLDLSIARGLDYYTGTIYETFLDDLPGIGSVCSGGRYDDLAGLFTKQRLPGVGASLGLDRLLAAMEELGQIESASTPAPVLMTVFDASRINDYLLTARRLRNAGLCVELFADEKAIGKQFKYADRRGFQLVVIAGPDEFAAGSWQVKDLVTGDQSTVADADLVTFVQQAIRPS